ncbi:hypothetical protein CPB86DRAFT_789027 [Serendipita vermifera]|nr:hypothetical protein CPB86DRAFT_789027 [Serendipita vermifera]
MPNQALWKTTESFGTLFYKLFLSFVPLTVNLESRYSKYCGTPLSRVCGKAASR